MLRRHKENNTLNFLTQEAAEKKLLIIWTDQALISEGNSSGDQLGIIGDIDKHPVTLKFAGHEIIAPSLLKKLLQSEDAKTIGNALDYESIADTPNFAGGKKLTVFKLSDLIKRSGDINGTYQVSQQEHHKTIVMVTHNMELAAAADYQVDLIKKV